MFSTFLSNIIDALLGSLYMSYDIQFMKLSKCGGASTRRGASTCSRWLKPNYAWFGVITHALVCV